MPLPLYQYPGLTEPLVFTADAPTVFLDWVPLDEQPPRRHPPRPHGGLSLDLSDFDTSTRVDWFRETEQPPKGPAPRPHGGGSLDLSDLDTSLELRWQPQTERPPKGHPPRPHGGAVLDPPGGEILPDHWWRQPVVPVPRRRPNVHGGSTEPPEQAPAAPDLTWFRVTDNPPLRKPVRPFGGNLDPIDTTGEVDFDSWWRPAVPPPRGPLPRPRTGSTEPPDATADIHLGHWWLPAETPPRGPLPRPRGGAVEPPRQDAEDISSAAWWQDYPVPRKAPPLRQYLVVHEIDPALFVVPDVVFSWWLQNPELIPVRPKESFFWDWFVSALPPLLEPEPVEPEPVEPTPDIIPVRVVIDDDTYRAIRRLWLASPLLARLFPDGPQAGRLKSPQTLPYAHMVSVQASPALRQTCAGRIDTRRVTITVRGSYAQVVQAVGEMVRVFGRYTVLDYPSGVRFIRWWPTEDETLEQEETTFEGQDVWRGRLEAEVWSVRTDHDPRE